MLDDERRIREPALITDPTGDITGDDFYGTITDDTPSCFKKHQNGVNAEFNRESAGTHQLILSKSDVKEDSLEFTNWGNFNDGDLDDLDDLTVKIKDGKLTALNNDYYCFTWFSVPLYWSFLYNAEMFYKSPTIVNYPYFTYHSLSYNSGISFVYPRFEISDAGFFSFSLDNNTVKLVNLQSCPIGNLGTSPGGSDLSAFTPGALPSKADLPKTKIKDFYYTPKNLDYAGLTVNFDLTVDYTNPLDIGINSQHIINVKE